MRLGFAPADATNADATRRVRARRIKRRERTRTVADGRATTGKSYLTKLGGSVAVSSTAGRHEARVEAEGGDATRRDP